MVFTYTQIIFLFNRFTQGDHVVPCSKENLHNHYPLHFQNWTTLKYILKEVWGHLSFVLEQPSPVSHKHKPKYLHLWRWAFQAPLFRRFPWLWLLMFLVVFLSSSLVTSVKPQLFYYLWHCHKKRVAILIYILREMILRFMFTR